MKSIFVTGGAGFIGSHTCLLLLEKGHVVFILDSFINSCEKSINQISIILKDKGIDTKGKIYLCKGDINNLEDIEKVFQMSIELNKEIESVIHFAGLKSVFESVMNPLIYWDTNVGGTINLLKTMKKFNCRNIVFSSSATVYGTNSIKPIDENSEIKPNNPYGHTKAAVEFILEDIFTKYSKEEIDKVNGYIDHKRDFLFTYAGLRQVVDKYLVQDRSSQKRFQFVLPHAPDHGPMLGSFFLEMRRCALCVFL